MSLRSKILVLLASVLAFSLAACAVAIVNLVRAAQDLQVIAERDIPLARVLTEITAAHLEQSIRFERALRFASVQGDSDGREAGYRAAKGEFDALSAEIWRSLQRARSIADSGDGAPHREPPESVLALLEQIDREHNEYARSVRRAFELVDRGEVARGVAFANGLQREEDRFDQALAGLLVQVGGRVEAASIEANAEADRTVLVVAALSGVGILLTASVFAYCVRLVSETRSLRGLLPICAFCKKIRDDHGYWNQLEAYLEENSEAEFTHGLCAECRLDLESKLPGEGPRISAGLAGGTASALG